MTAPRIDPRLFRLLAFERDWLDPLTAMSGVDDLGTDDGDDSAFALVGGQMEYDEANPPLEDLPPDQAELPPEDLPSDEEEWFDDLLDDEEESPEEIARHQSEVQLAAALQREARRWRARGVSLGIFPSRDDVFARAATPPATRDGASGFMRALDDARDDLTPERREFLRLTLFASETEWNTRLEQLRSTARALRARASLSLPPQIADDLSWGLAGAESCITSWQAAWRSDAGVRRRAPQRIEALKHAQAALLDAAESITTEAWIALRERAAEARPQEQTATQTTSPGTLHYYASAPTDAPM